jgi:hypothetical protein
VLTIDLYNVGAVFSVMLKINSLTVYTANKLHASGAILIISQI